MPPLSATLSGLISGIACFTILAATQRISASFSSLDSAEEPNCHVTITLTHIVRFNANALLLFKRIVAPATLKL